MVLLLPAIASSWGWGGGWVPMPHNVSRVAEMAVRQKTDQLLSTIKEPISPRPFGSERPEGAEPVNPLLGGRADFDIAKTKAVQISPF